MFIAIAASDVFVGCRDMLKLLPLLTSAVFDVDFRDTLKERAESGLYTGLHIGVVQRICVC